MEEGVPPQAAEEQPQPDPEPDLEPEPEPAAAAADEPASEPEVAPVDSLWQPLPAPAGGRAAQCEELEALAQQLLAGWDSYRRLEVDPKDAKKVLKAYEKNPSEKPAPLPPSHDARVASLDSNEVATRCEHWSVVVICSRIRSRSALTYLG